MTNDEGIYVDFFGDQACTMPSLAILAERSGAAIVPTFSYRKEGLKDHHVEFHKILNYERPSEDKTENIKHNTQIFTSIIESVIKKNPEQWIWMHKRWKTRPVK